MRIDGQVLEADLAAVASDALDGIVLATLPRDGAGASGAVVRRRAPARDRPVVGLVEDAAGLREIAAMARHPHLLTFGIGEVDLLADLRVDRARRRAAVDAIRLQVVVEAAAAGLAAPVAPTSTDFRDLDAFRDTTRAMVDLGFRSRTAIHPAQVPVDQRGADARPTTSWPPRATCWRGSRPPARASPSTRRVA